MGPLGCPETSVRNCRSTLRNIPEERRSRLLHGGSLKSEAHFTSALVHRYGECSSVLFRWETDRGNMLNVYEVNGLRRYTCLEPVATE